MTSQKCIMQKSQRDGEYEAMKCGNYIAQVLKGTGKWMTLETEHIVTCTLHMCTAYQQLHPKFYDVRDTRECSIPLHMSLCSYVHKDAMHNTLYLLISANAHHKRMEIFALLHLHEI